MRIALTLQTYIHVNQPDEMHFYKHFNKKTRIEQREKLEAEKK